MNDERQKIRYLKEVRGLTFRQIEKETGIPRKKASRIDSGLPAGARPRGFLLDPYTVPYSSYSSHNKTVYSAGSLKAVPE